MIYYIEITPFRVESCESDITYAVNESVVIRSKEGTDLGRVMKVEKEGIDDIYGKIISKATDEDFEKKNELKEYEEFCLLELKRSTVCRSA